MKIFGFNLGKNIKISFNTESVWKDEISNFGDRYFGLFTSKTINHNWVTKSGKEKSYEIYYRFGVDIIWFKFWIGYGITKNYQYSIKQKKNKTEIFWDI